jgi:hypothetical protein
MLRGSDDESSDDNVADAMGEGDGLVAGAGDPDASDEPQATRTTARRTAAAGMADAG